MLNVSLVFTPTAASQLAASGLTVEQIKCSAALTIETVARYKYLEYDYLFCEPIDAGGRKFQPSGGIVELTKNSIVFECSGLTELLPKTVQNPDGTTAVEWLPRNDGPALREYVEQRKKQQ
jgi:hypothetical protein